MRAANGTELVDDDRVARLIRAIDALHIDSAYFVDSLTEEIEALQPYRPAELPDDERRFIIESGGWTHEDFDNVDRDLERGALHTRMVTSWIAPFMETMSVWDASGLLDMDEVTVRGEVEAGRLYGVTIGGALRIPVWQVTHRRPQTLVPGLPETIAALPAADWDWRSVASFMSIPQGALNGEGAQTPAQWLIQGGDVASVVTLIEESGWI